MNKMNAIERNKPMIIILWGLIFAKCLTLEYLVQVYSVPINSFFYIWLLTFTMASVATAVFFRASTAENGPMETLSVVHLIWLGCGVTSLLIIGIYTLLAELNLYICLTILSVILGMGYLIHGILMRKHMYTCSGIGWWIGATALATRNNIENLPLFAFFMILLTVLPLIVEMRQRKIAFL